MTFSSRLLPADQDTAAASAADQFGDDRPPQTTAAKNEDLLRRRAEATMPVGPAAHQKVRDKGRMTARDRIAHLLDEGSFVETDALARHRTKDFGMDAKRPATDGIVTGWGTVDGREVCVFSQDGTVFGGALGEVYGEKMVKLQQLAIKTGRPIVGLYEGAGARIQDGAVSLDYIAQTFHYNVKASGVVPQISVIFGACAGGNAYSPALTDFVVMVENSSRMFVTGPDVIKTVTGEEITQEELGGASTHMELAGNTHYTATDDEDALDWVRDLLDHLPDNNRVLPEIVEDDFDFEVNEDDRALDNIIPDNPSQPYDVRDVISSLADDGDYMEIQEGRADNVVTLTRPLRVQGTTAIYEHDPKLIFTAGNEYRRFETATLSYPGMGIGSMDFISPYYHATVMTDKSRAAESYHYDQTQNGGFTVREYNHDIPESALAADYVVTHFTLDYPETPGLSFFIDSDAFQRRLGPESMMHFNRATGRYELTALLKQGQYSYQYLAVPLGAGAGTPARTDVLEGDHFETRNLYRVYVYRRVPGDRYDRLIGVATLRYQ